jgi:hypothetical protein
MALFVLALLFGLSSLAAASFVVRVARPSPPLAQVVGHALEVVGLWTVCLILNLGLGILAILSLRTFTSSFVSIYVLDDISIVLVSALQAFALHAWLSSSRRGDEVK